MIGQFLFLKCVVILEWLMPVKEEHVCTPFNNRNQPVLTSSLHISAKITGKRITLIFFADFIFLK